VVCVKAGDRLESLLNLIVVDTHPDNTHTLRIDTPFPALKEYAETLDLESMDSMDHSHVPWVVLLVKAASVWKASVSLKSSSRAHD
jgi:hypothetical protein